jgi:hypothetical protein
MHFAQLLQTLLSLNAEHTNSYVVGCHLRTSELHVAEARNNKSKAKAVPLHAMEVLWGERTYSSSFLTSALDEGEWSAPGKGPAVPTG